LGSPTIHTPRCRVGRGVVSMKTAATSRSTNPSLMNTRREFLGSLTNTRREFLGSLPPTRAKGLFDASVDPTEARKIHR
jgi:hypothetical protein